MWIVTTKIFLAMLSNKTVRDEKPDEFYEPSKVRFRESREPNYKMVVAIAWKI